MEKLKCKKCGGTILYNDYMYMEHGGNNDDTIICAYEGFCPKCGTEYTWVEEYKYKLRRNLEIVEY